MPRNAKGYYYEFHVIWLYLPGDNPERREMTVIRALSVPHALTRFYRAMASRESPRQRAGYLILEVANMGVTESAGAP